MHGQEQHCFSCACVSLRLTLVSGVHLLPGLRIALQIGFTLLSASFCCILIHFGSCFLFKLVMLLIAWCCVLNKGLADNAHLKGFDQNN